MYLRKVRLRSSVGPGRVDDAGIGSGAVPAMGHLTAAGRPRGKKGGWGGHYPDPPASIFRSADTVATDSGKDTVVMVKRSAPAALNTPDVGTSCVNPDCRRITGACIEWDYTLGALPVKSGTCPQSR